jgi:hypothetical protein
MTRGRYANHVHVTGTSDNPDAEHRPVTAPVTTLDDAIKTLQTAAAHSGAEKSAHALLDQTIRPRHSRAHTRTADRPGAPAPTSLRPVPPRPHNPSQASPPTPNYYPERQRRHTRSPAR